MAFAVLFKNLSAHCAQIVANFMALLHDIVDELLILKKDKKDFKHPPYFRNLEMLFEILLEKVCP